MKAKLIGAAVLAGAALAACGGKASFTIGGTVNGLSNQGLVLQNGSDTVAVPAGATTFAFPNQIDYGTEYNVSIKTQPDHMECTVPNGHGSAGRTASINVVVNCSQKTYYLGGKVVNLKGSGLTIINGSSSGQLVLNKDATEFSFANIPVGTAYGLAVLKQPTDPAQVCTITNPTGVMGDADRMNVVITCQ
ncbi:hypothetical protein [Pseudoduganella sp. OTU4001]|uniref:hypothetical protein n=1 Tax=Pseudoduganella sp. OTU4001 TaxID=3043854 RepID=UPI00313D58C0